MATLINDVIDKINALVFQTAQQTNVIDNWVTATTLELSSNWLKNEIGRIGYNQNLRPDSSDSSLRDSNLLLALSCVACSKMPLTAFKLIKDKLREGSAINSQFGQGNYAVSELSEIETFRQWWLKEAKTALVLWKEDQGFTSADLLVDYSCTYFGENP